MLAVKEEMPDMFYGTEFQHVTPFRTQLLKWIGNKQRFAHQIASYFPTDIRTYFEPFLGSGAVLAALQPRQAVGSDAFGHSWRYGQPLPLIPRKSFSGIGQDTRSTSRSRSPLGMNALKPGITPAQMERIYSSCAEAATAESCGFGNLTDTCQHRVARIRQSRRGRSPNGYRYGDAGLPARHLSRWTSAKPCAKQKEETWYTAIHRIPKARQFCTKARDLIWLGSWMRSYPAKHAGCGLHSALTARRSQDR